MTLRGAPKREAVTALIRGLIADGTLKPGDPAPAAAALARESGCHVVTAGSALMALLADGTLARGASMNGRLRVAQPGGYRHPAPETVLSRTLAARRRVKGLTQPDLAAQLGVSVTTVGHAETGRTWQARAFWQCADEVLGCKGDLLRLYDDYRAAGDAVPEEPAPVLPVLPASAALAAAGVLVAWPGGTETLAVPPQAQSW